MDPPGGRGACGQLIPFTGGWGGCQAAMSHPSLHWPPTELLCFQKSPPGLVGFKNHVLIPYCRPEKLLIVAKYLRERVDRVWLQLCHLFYARSPRLGRGSPRRRLRTSFCHSRCGQSQARVEPAPVCGHFSKEFWLLLGGSCLAPRLGSGPAPGPSVGGARKHLLRPRSHPSAPRTPSQTSLCPLSEQSHWNAAGKGLWGLRTGFFIIITVIVIDLGEEGRGRGRE